MNEIKRFEFTPVLGWSSSRYDIFQMCKRKYYYTYYAKFDSEYSRKDIDKLKFMTTIPLEIGNIVHDVNKVLLERLQKTEDKINKEKYFDFAYRKTEEYCSQKVFAEIYYKEISKLDMDELFDRVKGSLDNFLNSERFEWLINKAVGNKHGWVIEPPGYGETRIEGLKAYCKVDFLFPLDDCFYILDWKTGKPNDDKHKKQLIGYASWASFHFDKDPSLIYPIISYLYPEYQEKQITINEFDIQEFTGIVKSETDQMYKFCDNIKDNIPIEKDAFTLTPFDKLCPYCNFRELCGR